MTCADCGMPAQGGLCTHCRRDRERDGDWALDYEADGTDEDDDPDDAAPVVADGGHDAIPPSIGERVTYYDSEGVPHRALVTWVFGEAPGPAPMINCVRGADFTLGDTDATDGDYGGKVHHETSVDHATAGAAGDASPAHSYTRGWLP